MRRIRIFSVIIFVLAVGSFAGFRVYNFLNSDYAGPQITMDSDTITISCEAEEEEALAGIQAVDAKDGDVTDSLIVETQSNFIEEGRRKITVAAFDSDNHVTKASREVIYSDYRSPRFSLEHPLRFPVDTTEDILEGVKATDVLDGDITGNIKINSEQILDTSKTGEYPIELSVSNSVGDVVKLPVTVEIYDPSEEAGAPQIELSDYLVYTKKGKELNLWDYVEKVTLNGREFERTKNGILRDDAAPESEEPVTLSEEDISISGTVDYNTVGVYEITYEVTTENDVTGDVRLLVVVTNRGGNTNE